MKFRSSTRWSSLLSFALLSCAPTMVRVPCHAELVASRAIVPSAAPQVMIAEPAPPQPVQVLLSPATPMTEEQRTEKFRAAGSPIRPYTPPPLPDPPRRTVVVERAVYRDAYAGPCFDHYYYDYDCGRGWDRRCSWGPSLPRLATYTIAGAIIGHQFHERGRGAAIGAGLALLSWPWHGCCDDGWDW